MSLGSIGRVGVLAFALVCFLDLGSVCAQQGVPKLDEVMGYEGTGAIKYDPADPNHSSVARIEFLGTTKSVDGDYQYWYDVVTGNKAWTRNVSFWVSNADTISNLAGSNYSETSATHVLEHWWGSPMAHKGLDGWGGHRDPQNSPSHGVAGSWILTAGHPDPIFNEFHQPIDYNVPGFWGGQPTVFFWGPPARTDDSLILSDGTPVWRFEKHHNEQLLANGMNPYAFAGLCGTFIIESPSPPAEDVFGWSTYHNTTVDDSLGPVSSFGYLPGPGGSGDVPFEITELDYAPETGVVTLTWRSTPGETFGIEGSTDLSIWNVELDDNILAGDGETTTASYNLSTLGLGDIGALFFRVRRL